ncbi:MAG: hypothetical protein DMG22_09525 [Acidobacteria bacterium]|nr:MAG: hypothetical protein DMG22_09525 [Acidobacteriota bacterium]
MSVKRLASNARIEDYGVAGHVLQWPKGRHSLPVGPEPLGHPLRRSEGTDGPPIVLVNLGEQTRASSRAKEAVTQYVPLAGRVANGFDFNPSLRHRHRRKLGRLTPRR